MTTRKAAASSEAARSQLARERFLSTISKRYKSQRSPTVVCPHCRLADIITVLPNKSAFWQHLETIHKDRVINNA